MKKIFCVLVMLVGACVEQQEPPTVGSIKGPTDVCRLDDGVTPQFVEALSAPPTSLNCTIGQNSHDIVVTLNNKSVTVEVQEECLQGEILRTFGAGSPFGGSALFDTEDGKLQEFIILRTDPIGVCSLLER